MANFEVGWLYLYVCTWLVRFLHNSGIIRSNDWAIKSSKYLSRNFSKVRSPRPTSSSILFSPSACLALSTALAEFHMASIGFSGAEYGPGLRIDNPAYWGSLSKISRPEWHGALSIIGTILSANVPYII